MGQSDLAIIIPAWNEEKTIGTVVRASGAYGDVIVVNDCSTDKTAVIAEESGAIVVSHVNNKGYDGALNSGFSKASDMGYDYAITFDADGQHDHTMIARYYELLKTENDLVLGIRPFQARFGEQIFAWVMNFSCGIRDPLCGMKGYRLALYRQRGWFDSCQSIGTELAIWGCKTGKKFVQIEIPVHSRADTPRFGRRFRANIKLLKALFRVQAAVKRT